MQHMESVLCSSACLKELEELYTEAFPANERMPFSQMLSLSKDDRYALRALKDDGAFCGFSFIMRHEEMIYLFYLAVRQDQRGKGYGSALLDDLFQQYPHHCICADIESPQPQADNQLQRLQRRRFYLDRGFADTGYGNLWYGIRYDILAAQRPFSLHAYQGAVDLLQTPRFPAKIFKREEGVKDE